MAETTGGHFGQGLSRAAAGRRLNTRVVDALAGRILVVQPRLELPTLGETEVVEHRVAKSSPAGICEHVAPTSGPGFGKIRVTIISGVFVHHFSSFDGLDVAYLDVGDGEPVVLLHGFAADHRANWVGPGVVEALVRAGRRVLAPDARGHGESAKPHEPRAYADDAMARDVVSLADHLDLANFDLVGYSMGAITAGRLAPVESRIRSLVLGGVGGRWAGERRSVDGDVIAAALETPDPAAIDDDTAREFRKFADRSGADRRALAAALRAEPGARARLESIAVPTMILVGDRDDLAGAPEGLAARIAGSTVQIVSGHHLSAVADPRFAQSIVDFVDSATLD